MADTMRYLTLDALQDSGKPIAVIWRDLRDCPDQTLATLAQRLVWPQARVRRCVDRLVEKGWAHRSATGKPGDPFRYAARTDGAHEIRQFGDPYKRLRDRVSAVATLALNGRNSGSLAGMRDALYQIEAQAKEIRAELYAAKLRKK